MPRDGSLTPRDLVPTDAPAATRIMEW